MFRRRTDASTPEPGPPLAAAASDQPASDQPAGGGKGRPTPRRRQAESERRAKARPVLDRKAEARRRREARRRAAVELRQAMASGDESRYPPRDRGPVRRFVRDYVDSRWTIAEFFLPILVVIFGLSLVNTPEFRLATSLAWVTSVLLVVLDSTLLGIQLKRQLRRRFPDDTGRGHVFYGIARATQLRRLRMPKPQVRRGEPPR